MRVGAAGTLDEFKLAGEFWEIQSLEPTGPIDAQAGDIITVSFRAVAADVSKPLRFHVEFNGRPVWKRLDLGPETFERAGKPGRVASVDAQGRAAPFHPVGGGGRSTTAAGQSLHLFGRIAYQRPTSPSDGTLITVGADAMWFEIMDDDSPDPFDETIYSGHTDPFGYFDVNVDWDDCDVTGCDDPDIYLRWETDNDVVNVQRSDLLEEDYSWSTQDNTIDDFTGSEVDFGTVMPGDPGQYPAIHIHNSIMRAYRYILLNSGTGIDVEELDVQWPEDEGGSGAFYTPFYEEIHIAPSRQWNEDTHTHEYGHHFLENYSVNPEPDYCNGVCDFNDACGHCIWCSETDHDAWNEGWPNWLGDVVTRFYPLRYGGYQPYATRSQENIQSCSWTTQPADPFLTEGYAGALCRDIEDATQDDHDGDAVFDCDTDAMSLGPAQIFQVVTLDKPSTIVGFIAAFRARFPQLDQDMWSTVRNVAPEFSFPLPPPTVVSQTQGCKTYVEGDTLSLNVQGNGSLLAYQWRRDGVNVFDSATVSGMDKPILQITPLADSDTGTYDCVVKTCDRTLSVTSTPVRVQVFAARGGGTNAAAFGDNGVGQLGNGLPGNLPPLSATPLAGLSGVVSISGDGLFATALRSDGTVWAWGYGRYGELGSSTVLTSTPVQVQGISDVIAISSKGNVNGHTLALKADGTVWAWGFNGYGQVGLPAGAPLWTPIPIQVPQLDCVTSVAAGSSSSIASRSDGTVWTWGDNTYGQRGSGTLGGAGHTLTQVPGITDAVAVNAGGYHALVVRSNGTIAAWGYNTQGQLGDGTFITRGYPVLVGNLTNVRFVTAGAAHSLAILDDGAVRVWG